MKKLFLILVASLAFASAAFAGQVNLNTASESELDALKGDCQEALAWRTPRLSGLGRDERPSSRYRGHHLVSASASIRTDLELNAAQQRCTTRHPP